MLLPSNADCEGSFGPVSPFDDGHLAADVASWAIEDLVRVPVFLGVEATVVAMAVALVRMCVRHDIRRE